MASCWKKYSLLEEGHRKWILMIKQRLFVIVSLQVLLWSSECCYTPAIPDFAINPGVAQLGWSALLLYVRRDLSDQRVA
jgi:hypothetical protein